MPNSDKLYSDITGFCSICKRAHNLIYFKKKHKSFQSISQSALESAIILLDCDCNSQQSEFVYDD